LISGSSLWLPNSQPLSRNARNPAGAPPDKEVEDQRRALLSAGFYPYIIRGADGKSLLYSGAIDRKEYAEKERSALASKGIQSEVVER